jgi:DNA-binding transcriptional ArsR family regulator
MTTEAEYAFPPPAPSLAPQAVREEWQRLVWRWRTHPAEKLLGLALVENADQRGAVEISHAELVVITGLSERHVRRSLKDLADRGLISRSHRRDGSNRYRYRLQWPQEVV